MGKTKGGGVKKNTSCYLQLLGLGVDTQDTTPCVLLFFDNERYLFNCGEGFQRFCIEHKVKSAKINDIFFTRATTEAAGGLPGLLLTLADKVATPIPGFEKTMGVYGPRGMRAFADCLRTFVNVKDIRLKVREVALGDGGMGSEASSPAATQLASTSLVRNDVVEISCVLVDSAVESDAAKPDVPESKRQRIEGEATREGVQTAIYLIELADIPGKFLPNKAAALGVPRGPAYGRLCRGESVPGANGAIVAPADVMEPAAPGPCAVILDLPSVSYLPALGGAEGSFMARMAAQRGPVVVVHMSSSHVTSDPAYAAFLKAWPVKTEHVFLHHPESQRRSAFPSSQRLQREMHNHFPAYFPLHVSSDDVASDVAGPKAAVGDKGVLGENMLKYWLRPVSRMGAERDAGEATAAEARPTAAEVSEEAKAGVAGRMRPLAADAPQPPACVGLDRELEVTFLGTGSAIPSKYRNVR